MFERFQRRSFKPESLELIDHSNEIISEYQRQGFVLTLRQLYYQLVSKALIENNLQTYKKLGILINNARLCGMIDWSAIEDRTRNVRHPAAWDSPTSILEAVAGQYREHIWEEQRYAPEVWIEKDALLGVIEPVCRRMRVPFFACRGYTSQSEAYSAGKRLAGIRGREPVVLHLGDHDPSGLDMTRDNAARLALFAKKPIRVIRLGLNMDQIETYGPPPNPAKESDIRFRDYQRQHGDESWELDALSPPVIDALIQDTLDTLIDRRAWNASLQEEQENKDRLQAVHDRWDDVQTFLDA